MCLLSFSPCTMYFFALMELEIDSWGSGELNLCPSSLLGTQGYYRGKARVAILSVLYHNVYMFHMIPASLISADGNNCCTVAACNRDAAESSIPSTTWRNAVSSSCTIQHDAVSGDLFISVTFSCTMGPFISWRNNFWETLTCIIYFVTFQWELVFCCGEKLSTGE